MVARKRRAGRHARNLQWADDMQKASMSWECAPDQQNPSTVNTTVAMKINPVTVHPANPCDGSPSGTLRLQCADGHLFDVEISHLWSSSVVRALVQDSGLDADLPLPGTAWKSMSAFLELCSHPKQDLAALLPVGTEHECLREVIWVARLLDMEHVLGEGLALYLNTHVIDEEHLYCSFRAADLFFMLRVSVGGLSESVLSCLLKATMRASDSCGHNRMVDPMLPFEQLLAHVAMQLNHSSQMVRQSALECLQSSASPSAQAVLLRHRDLTVRFGAIKLLGRVRSPQAAEAVLKVITLDSFQAREAAARALAVSSPIGYWPSVLGLTFLLEDHVREVRQGAVYALREVAVPDDPGTVEILLAKTMHEDWPVRCAALEGLTIVLQQDQDMVRSIAEQVKQSTSTVEKCIASRLLKTAFMNGTQTNSADSNQMTSDSVGTGQRTKLNRWSDGPSDSD